MICPHIVNVSMLLGSVITWGFLWPFIDSKAGHWFPAGLGEHDFSGLFGYKARALLQPGSICWSGVLHGALQCHGTQLHGFVVPPSGLLSMPCIQLCWSMMVSDRSWVLRLQVVVAMAVFLGDCLGT